MSSAKNERLLWLVGMKCAKIRTKGKAQRGETRIHLLEAELKMVIGQAVDK